MLLFLCPAISAQETSDLPAQAMQGTPVPRKARAPSVESPPLHSLLARQWTIDDGLPSHTLLDVARTGDGFLWIASYNGLIRFDGLGFELLAQDADPRLRSSAFTGLHKGVAHTLWVGTQGSGVWHLRDGVLTPYSTDDLLGITVLCLLIDRDRNIWLGTNNGLFRKKADAKNFSKVRYPGLDSPRIRDLDRDADGVIWVAGESTGLGRIEDDSFRRLTPEDGLAGLVVNSLERQKGKLWIGTLEGVSVLDADGLRTLEETRSLNVTSLHVDEVENLWIGTTQGLGRRDGRTGRLEFLKEADGIPLRDVSQTISDSEGSIWVTSRVDGLIQLRPSSFETFTPKDGLHTDRVSSIDKGKDGAWLLGMDDGTVQRLHEGKLENFPIRTPLPETRIRGVTVDRRGRYWISSYAGLLRIADGRETLFTPDDGLPTRQIRSTLEDRDGRLWITARNGGLIWIDDLENPTFEVLDQDDGMPSSFVFSIAEMPAESPGPIRWIANTGKGLALIGPGEAENRPRVLRVVNDPEQLPGSVIFNVLLDDRASSPAGPNLWMATNGGLGRLDGDRLRRMTRDEGFPTESIFDIERDGLGHLWISSSIGLIRVREQDLLDYLDGRGALPSFKILTEKHGMSHRQCTAATSMLWTDDGRLAVPTFGGLSVLKPTSLTENFTPPPIVIQKVIVDGRSIPARGPVEVEPGVKRVAFSFAGLSFAEPLGTELWYRLEGFDEDWIRAEDQRHVLYTNLDPGAYRFRVVGANADGVWNREGASLRLILHRPPHQNPWFLGFAGAVLLFSGWQLLSWRARTAQRRSARLQAVVDRQRLTAAENEKLIRELEAKNREVEIRREELERFTYTVSHDLKSPLVTIRGFAGALQEDLAYGHRDQAEEDLKLILGASERMERLLRELSTLTRIGHLENNPEAISMTEIAWEAVALTAGSARASDAQIEVQMQMPVVRVDRSRIIEVFQNLIENALKFSRPDVTPHIFIGHEMRDGDDVFFVSDNGVGIPPEHVQQIFGLFKRLGQDKEGTGVGLALVKRAVEVHGGRIWAESEGKDLGCTFCFTLKGIPKS